jgi:hypothetical protein
MSSQSHSMCVADSSFSRHLLHVGWSVNSSLKRCPFIWQYPVHYPTTQLNWCLLNFNRSFIILAEALIVSPFACLSPVMDSQCFLWFLFVQSPTAWMATPIVVPQAGSGPRNECSGHVLASWSAISLSTVSSWPGTHISWTLMFGQLYEVLMEVPD